eukprot:4387735-Amphidinium_carterae.1
MLLRLKCDRDVRIRFHRARFWSRRERANQAQCDHTADRETIDGFQSSSVGVGLEWTSVRMNDYCNN